MEFLKRFAKRLGFTLLTILAMSVLIFFLVEIMPGDVAQTVLGQSSHRGIGGCSSGENGA